MTLSLGEVLLFLGFVGYGVYLFQALRVRELALDAARRACREHGVQLLDESVAVRKISTSAGQRPEARTSGPMRRVATRSSCATAARATPR